MCVCVRRTGKTLDELACKSHQYRLSCKLNKIKTNKHIYASHTVISAVHSPGCIAVLQQGFTRTNRRYYNNYILTNTTSTADRVHSVRNAITSHVTAGIKRRYNLRQHYKSPPHKCFVNFARSLFAGNITRRERQHSSRHPHVSYLYFDAYYDPV